LSPVCGNLLAHPVDHADAVVNVKIQRLCQSPQIPPVSGNVSRKGGVESASERMRKGIESALQRTKKTCIPPKCRPSNKGPKGDLETHSFAQCARHASGESCDFSWSRISLR
jgi:hypothetical protein